MARIEIGLFAQGSVNGLGHLFQLLGRDRSAGHCQNFQLVNALLGNVGQGLQPPTAGESQFDPFDGALVGIQHVAGYGGRGHTGHDHAQPEQDGQHHRKRRA